MDEESKVTSEEKEILKIFKLDDSDGKIPKRISSNTKMPMILNNVRAIVIHHTEAPGQKMIEETLPWMIKRGGASYHHVITEEGKIVEMVSPEAQVNHTGATKYTRFATEYFGDTTCPPFEHSPTTPHLSSPNVCTIGVCVAVIDKEFNINDLIYNSLVRDLAYLFNRYAPGLSPIKGREIDLPIPGEEGFVTKGKRDANLLRHSDISDTKAVKCPAIFFKDPSFFHRLQHDVNALSRKWLATYIDKDDNGTKIKRGYPELHIETIKYK
jgi:hypothetical protein